MFATDAIAELTAHFRLDRVGMVADGNAEYDFDNGFAFTATELDDTRLQLVAVLPGLDGRLSPEVRRRLLEASVNGVETGPGRIGRHPTLGIALIEALDCGPLTVEDFRLRVVDFMLHAEYWRSEGVARILSEAAPPPSDAISFRL
jgi:hypothetical protein